MTATPKLLSEVEDAMAGGSVTRRGKIVRHITDLFIVGSAQCSDQEIELFDDVLTRLAVEIEVSARALLAVRLAPIENAPPRIIRALAFDDEIDVAGPVLEQSERLDDAALVENAQKKSQEHLLAISRRRSLNESVLRCRLYGTCPAVGGRRSACRLCRHPARNLSAFVPQAARKGIPVGPRQIGSRSPGCAARGP